MTMGFAPDGHIDLNLKMLMLLACLFLYRGSDNVNVQAHTVTDAEC